MDFCAVVFGIVFALVLVAIIGHPLWLLAEAMFRVVFGPRNTPPGLDRLSRKCPHCGTRYSVIERNCPACGLDRSGPAALELGELEITAEQVEALVDAKKLPADVAEQVHEAIQARRQDLADELRPAFRSASGRTGPFQTSPFQTEKAAALLETMESLLADCPDVRQLPVQERRQALACYRKMNRTELAQLSAGSLLCLARLLRMAGFSSRALEAYDNLLTHHPASLPARPGAIEGGRFALREGNRELGLRYLLQARTYPLSPEDRQEVDRLLGPLLDEEPAILPVIVVEEPATIEPRGAAAVPPTPRDTVAAEAAPARPRATWGQLLAGFMEERNILWGEVVGGLLIVGCSIALAISLWQTLEIKHFPFLILTLLTAALFGGGLYTLRHWKLEATSRGLLTIANLLTPLNFLVLAGLSPGEEQGPIDWGTEAASLAVFSWMLFISARILVGGLPGWSAALLTLAVAGASASQLMVPRWLDLAEPVVELFALLSLAPVIVHALAGCLVLWGLARRDRVDAAAGSTFFLFLGQTTFAAVVALGFIVYWSDEPLQSLRHLAVPFTVAGLPLLLGGSLVSVRLSGTAVDTSGLRTDARQNNLNSGEFSYEDHPGLNPGLVRLAGTVIALSAMAIMLGALALGWPRPLALFVIGVTNAAAFSVVALALRLPHGHGPALASLAVAFLTAFHVIGGDLPLRGIVASERMLDLARSPASGVALMLLGLALAGSSEWLARAGRRLDAVCHVSAAGIAALLAMVLVSWDDPASGRGILVFFACALAGSFVNLRWQKPWLTGICSWTFLGAIAFSYYWSFPERSLYELWVAILLTHASIAMGRGIFLSWQDSRPEDGPALSPTECVFAVPLKISALVSTVLALCALAAMTEWKTLVEGIYYCLWLSGIWYAFSLSTRSRGWFAAGQAAVTLAVLYACTAWLERQALFAPIPQFVSFLEVPTYQVYCLGLAGLGLFWLLVRRATPANWPMKQLLEAGWRWVDGPLQGLVIFVNLALAFLVAGAETFREIDPGNPPRPFPALAFALDRALALQAILALTFLGYFWERRMRAAVLGLMLLAATVPMVWAVEFRPELAVASALRWGWGLAFLVCSGLLWLRRDLARIGQRLGMSLPEERRLPAQARTILLLGMLIPILTLTWWTGTVVLPGWRLAGPVEGSYFHRLGLVPSILGPLLMLVVGLTGHGVRENSSGYLFSAGLVLLAAVVGGYALAVVHAGHAVDSTEAAFLLQLGVVQVAVWALAWLALGHWREPMFLETQMILGFVGNVCLLVPALVRVTFREAPFSGWVIQSGSLPGWLGWAGCAAAGVWTFRLIRPRQVVHALGMAGLGWAFLSTLTAAQRDIDGWLSYHVLTLAMTTLALGMLAGSWAGARVAGQRSMAQLLATSLPAAPSRRWVEGLASVVVLLTLYGAWEDPWRPYLSAAVVLALSVLFGAMALWTGRPGYVYVSGLLFNVIALLIWQGLMRDPDWTDLFAAFDGFLLSQVLGLASASVLWSLVGLVLRPSVAVGSALNDTSEPRTAVSGASPGIRREMDSAIKNQQSTQSTIKNWGVPFAHVAGVSALVILVFLASAGIFADLAPVNYRLPFPAIWWALGMTGAALLVTLWDPLSKFGGLPGAPMYVLGLVTIGLFLHWLSLPPALYGWGACLVLAIYVYEVSAGYHVLPRYAWLAQVLRLPSRPEPVRAAWYLPAQGLLGLLALILSIWICLHFADWEDRMYGPLAAGLIAWASVWAVFDWPRLKQHAAPWGVKAVHGLVYASLSLGLVVLVEIGWAIIDPDAAAPWLHRMVALFAALLVGGAFYGTGLSRILANSATDLANSATESPWPRCLRPMSGASLLLAGAVFVILLGQEFALYDANLRRTPMELPAVLLVAGLLVASIFGAVREAVSSRDDPMGWSDRARMRLVWLAEVIVVLVFLHVRLNRPDWIPSFLGPYWPLFIMALGFAGVGLAEVFRRRGLTMLSEPLQRTGIFLPLLPLLAYLVRPLADVKELGQALPGIQPLLNYLHNLPAGFAMHSLLWFLLATLYLQVAVMRRTSTFAFLACLAANFGLWVIYAHHGELAFLLHPQMWLIPLGLIILAAEHWHRDSLSKEQSAGLRYLGLLLIFLSSSADMFITGLGNSVLLPLVLAVLSIAGVLAGILLRVRAFLFLGVTFLFLVIFAQIWHAAVDRAHTWVWWASGIVLGAAILALFAVFEKRRNDVLRIVDDIKRWQ